MKRPVLLVLLVVLSLVPPILYMAVVLPVARVTTVEARRLLADEGAAIVDVRTPEEFKRDGLAGAINVPLASIEADANAAWPKELTSKKRVLLICNVGVRSAIAADRLRKAGISNAASIEGGLDQWRRTGAEGKGNDACMLNREEVLAGSRVEFTRFEQLAITVSAFGIKPLYEITALIVGLLLWRRKESDLVALKWAMFAFFIGENACAVNYLFFGETSILWEYLHCLGMLLAFGLATYAIMTLLDGRVVHYSAREKKCALLPLCRQCYKHAEVGCNLRYLFLFAIGCLALTVGIMFMAPISPMMTVGPVLGGDVVFSHPRLFQALEVRLCPGLALPFFALAAWTLWRQHEEGFERAKVWLAIGLGPLGFGLLRFLIFWSFRQRLLWADLTEELTETAFILGVVLVLRLFRKSLLAMGRGRWDDVGMGDKAHL